jgi:rsbT co-antagonist protein RsbR
MPIIGNIDDTRAARVIEALLQGLHKARARFAILDITGVPSVDAQTADALLRAARAVQLLGAQVVLTGIRPEVAQTLIALGTSLGGIVTCGNLESGIAYATSRR